MFFGHQAKGLSKYIATKSRSSKTEKDSLQLLQEPNSALICVCSSKGFSALSVVVVFEKYRYCRCLNHRKTTEKMCHRVWLPNHFCLELLRTLHGPFWTGLLQLYGVLTVLSMRSGPQWTCFRSTKEQESPVVLTFFFPHVKDERF